MNIESRVFIIVDQHGERYGVFPTEKFGRADHWNTESEAEHQAVEEAFNNHVDSLPKFIIPSRYFPEKGAGDWIEPGTWEIGYHWHLDDKWFLCNKEHYDRTADQWKRLVIIEKVGEMYINRAVYAQGPAKDTEAMYIDARQSVKDRISKQKVSPEFNSLMTGIGFDMFLAGVAWQQDQQPVLNKENDQMKAMLKRVLKAWEGAHEEEEISDDERNDCRRCGGMTQVEQGGDIVDCPQCKGEGMEPLQKILDPFKFTENVEAIMFHTDDDFFKLIGEPNDDIELQF